MLGIPLLAVAGTAAVGLAAAQRYTATAYVAAPALPLTGTQAVNQFVAGFSAAVTAPVVIDGVSKETGVPAGTLRDGLAVEQVGASSQLTVTYTTTKRDTVAPVLREATKRALTFLFSSQVTIASGQVDAAQSDVDAATKAITVWETANRVSQPDKQYQATLNEMASLRQQLLSMQAVGNQTGARAAQAAIDAAQRRLDELGPKLPDYQALVLARDAATGTLSRARETLQAARAQQAAADPEKVATIGAVGPVSRGKDLLRTLPAAAGAGLLLAVLLVMGLEWRAARRR
ncbi:hypothetical protein Val02_10640 [Virgisporangium aliadipatigenens]|uniref:Polysaccharide chain length determinant N-terminal domain-containing protein n=1 Tax=Virgisporangium aliadipatigenens TaxID=741659 RepID=A0A8J3YH97_9ACTN|nr:hypothetical protein Val02_10640 [Virgisporangium aliadipatigenens]